MANGLWTGQWLLQQEPRLLSCKSHPKHKIMHMYVLLLSI